MIHKIEKISSVGRYRDFQASGDIAFKKLTLFYGNNGGGKTTLTNIFRSLTSNNASLITRRISTNNSIPQAVQIIQRTSSGDISHSFHHTNGWNRQLDGIEIFDTYFIHENVYSGFEFNEEQKKQLHSFVIGAQGVHIRQQIELNKSQKTTVRQNIIQFEEKLVELVGEDFSADLISLYLTIPCVDANIAQLIIDAEAALTIANANSVIQSTKNLEKHASLNPSFKLDQIASDLQKTPETLQNETLETLFKDHTAHLLSNKILSPSQWLKIGFNYVESQNSPESSCPFCKQHIHQEMDIFKAYTAHFNENFNQHIGRLQNHLKDLKEWNLEAFIQQSKSIKAINADRIHIWVQHLNDINSPECEIFLDNNDETQELLQKVITDVQTKLQYPTEQFPDIELLQLHLQRIQDEIKEYNKKVDEYNSNIARLQSTVQPVASAYSRLQQLKRIKKRFNPDIEQACSSLIAEKGKLKELETSYVDLVRQQEIAATTFFANYKDRINFYLNAFGTIFKIDDVLHVPPKGKAVHSKVSYKLTIDGKEISFNLEQSNSAKECLSEGDKSTIALAFFIAKLDIDTQLSNKIIVFDDPLSSFDSNRRMKTVQIIKDLATRVKQIIVLSHNQFFINDIAKLFAANEKKTLHIAQNYALKSSLIEPLILEDLVENDYFKHIKELGKFLTNPQLSRKDDILGMLRNVLEAHIRFKFYRQLSSLQGNNQTFGKLIEVLITQGVVFRNDADRANILSTLNIINGISCKPHHGEPIPDYTSLGVDPDGISETELASFVTSTLQLIDHDL